ncbi:hypothetical protein RB195_014764 [Necator americanus]|uniref:Uncharacterized protein n=1 Tax=Necator americanus TaxID=51031 RepID=A0ABR1E1J4_NECAM
MGFGDVLDDNTFLQCMGIFRHITVQLDYENSIRKSRAVWDVAFESDHHPVLLGFKKWFHKRNREVPLQPKIDVVGLKDDDEMQNKIPPTCVYSCWSTDQKEA